MKIKADVRISQSAALLKAMVDEEDRLTRQLAELVRQQEQVMERRTAIRVCREALERSFV